MEVEIGKKFNSIEEVYSFISAYEKLNYVQLNKRKASKLSSAYIKTRCSKRSSIINQKLVYYELLYKCVHGGPYKYDGKNARKSKTTKFGCQMEIKFRVSPDGQHLIIAAANSIHNHPISKDLFMSLPKQRKLSDKERQETCKMLELKCNKKLLKNYIKSSTGKVLTLKDLSNIKASVNKSENDLVDAITFLETIPEAIVKVVVDEEDNLTGIYFQDEHMKKSFKFYPELLLFDATYKLNSLRMPLYILLIVDGNGHGEVVGTFLLTNENESTIQHMIQIFKQHNEQWAETVSIITDKDFTERKVFVSEFPDAQLLLCLFHTLKTFRTQITTEKMNISSSERDVCLRLLQQLAYSKNEDEYSKNYKILLTLEFKKVTEYYNKNWHPIRKEWVEGMKKRNVTFSISTTNHLESINNKIKQVVSQNSNLKTFYEHFFVMLDSMRDELRSKAMCMSTKINVHHYGENSPEYKYLSLLTPYAFKFVENSLVHANNAKSVKSEYNTTSCDCTCSFYICMRLPCYHIFFIRRLNGIDLFDKSLVHNKFTKENYIKFHTSEERITVASPNEILINLEQTKEGSDMLIETLVKPKKRILTSNEKFKKTMGICQQLAGYFSEIGTTKFDNNYKQLELFVQLTMEGKKVIVCEETENLANEQDRNDGSNLIVSNLEHRSLNLGNENVDEHNIVDNENGVININLRNKKVGTEENKSYSIDDNLTQNIILNDHDYCLPVKNNNLHKDVSLSALTRINYKQLKVKRIGRPKGAECTVVGIKKKKTVKHQ